MTRGHASCATRAAAHARAAGEDPGDAVAAAGHAAPAAQGATRWSIVRTAPLVLDSTSSSRSPAGRRQLLHRSIGAVLAVGLAALALARLVEPASSSVSPGVLAATGAPSAAALVAAATPTRAAPDRSSSAPTSSPPSAAAPRSAAPSRPLASRGSGAYVVRPGDTLYSIARAYHTTVEKLQELNDLAGSTVIRAGQELVLP